MKSKHDKHGLYTNYEETPDELILDGTKISWHQERIKKWEKGERIAPITIDLALTRSCNYGCHFCYAMVQENDRSTITKEHIRRIRPGYGLPPKHINQILGKKVAKDCERGDALQWNLLID